VASDGILAQYGPVSGSLRLQFMALVLIHFVFADVHQILARSGVVAARWTAADSAGSLDSLDLASLQHNLCSPERKRGKTDMVQELLPAIGTGALRRRMTCAHSDLCA
jgi:hypothetical protein